MLSQYQSALGSLIDLQKSTEFVSTGLLETVSQPVLDTMHSLNLNSLTEAPVVGSGKSIHTYHNYADNKGTIDYYWVIGDNFHNGTINVDDYSVRIRLLCYGLSQQAKFGDNNSPKPSFYDIKASWKWDAWNKQMGRRQEDSRRDFIMLAEAMLGSQSDDPEL